jgi:hypothetical protein
VQLELLETDRFVALCHNEAPTLDEEPVLATAHPSQVVQHRCYYRVTLFLVCHRTRG